MHCFGFDIILAETVGVGQSETTVGSNICDFYPPNVIISIITRNQKRTMEPMDMLVITKNRRNQPSPAQKICKERIPKGLHFYPVKENG